MRKDVKSLAEKVFLLVKSLSSSEKAIVMSIGKMKGREKKGELAMYLQLFILYSKALKFQPDIFRKKLKGDKASWIVSNRYLRKFILESLASGVDDEKNTLSIASIALERGFPKYAKQILEKELRVSIEKGLSGRGIELSEKLEIVTKYHLGEASGFGENDALSAFYANLSVYSRCSVLSLLFREALGKNMQSRKDIHDKHEMEVQELQKGIYLPRTEYQLLRTVRLFHSLVAQYEKVKSCQPRIVQLFERHADLFPLEKQIDETHLQITFLMSDKDYEGARRQLIDLASKEYPNHIQSLVDKTWVIDSIYLAAVSGDLEYAPRAVLDFGKFEHLLAPKQKVRLCHALSIIFFHREEWEKVLFWQTRVSSYGIKKKMRIAWVPMVMRALSYFEQGYSYKAKSTIKKFFDSDLAQEHIYPSMILTSLKPIIEAEQNIIGQSHLYVEMQREYQKMKMESLEFQTESFVLPLEAWLEAKIKRKPLSQIAEERKQSGIPLFQLG